MRPGSAGAAVLARCPTSFFTAFAQESKGIGMGWLETYLTPHDQVLATIGGQTRKDFLEDDHWTGMSDKEFDNANIREVLDKVLKDEFLTGSCGSTAGLIHGIVNPTSALTVPTAMGVPGLIDALRRAHAVSSHEGVSRYVRIEGGGHAFVVETGADGRCRLLQSFFGTSTLARDLGSDKAYGLGELLELMRLALTATDGLLPKEKSDIVRARRQLFSSQAVHPELRGFMVHEFGCEAGMRERLANLRIAGEQKWQQVLGKPSSAITFLPPPTSIVLAPALTGQHTVLHSDSSYWFYDEKYESVATAKLVKGMEGTLRHGGHMLSVVINDNTGSAVTFTVDV